VEEAIEDTLETTDVLKSVFLEFGQWPPQTVLTETGLAEVFNKHNVSIKRAVERGELPPPTRLMGRPIWTVRVIVDHIESRLSMEAERKEELEQTIKKFHRQG
jgi:hypothetical protein